MKCCLYLFGAHVQELHIVPLRFLQKFCYFTITVGSTSGEGTLPSGIDSVAKLEDSSPSIWAQESKQMILVQGSP